MEEAIIELALAEDTGRGDVTSEVLISDDLQGEAYIEAKEEGVLCGVKVAGDVFRRVDNFLDVVFIHQDGDLIHQGDRVLIVKGRMRSILKAERTALNFLAHLSGVATLTARYVRAISGLGVVIAATRKTTPGLRALEKYAVTVGGGYSYRLDLGSSILIKDNHIAVLRGQGLDLNSIVSRAIRESPHGTNIAVEVVNLDEAREAVEAGAKAILLDNMGLEDMSRVVQELKGKVVIEASGGITLENVRQVALLGVDLISVGALTHSARSIDMSLEVIA
jgi:nicotinate-nucleotide pyrophosphorylase (carboxylating)